MRTFTSSNSKWRLIKKLVFRKIKVFQPLSYSSIPKCWSVKVENMITYHYGTEEVTPYAGLIFCVWLFNLNSLDFRGGSHPSSTHVPMILPKSITSKRLLNLFRNAKMFPLNISLLSELAVKSLTRRGFHTGGRGGGPLNTSNKRGEIRKFDLSKHTQIHTLTPFCIGDNKTHMWRPTAGTE